MVKGGTDLSFKFDSNSLISDFSMYFTKIVQSWQEGSSRKVFDKLVNLSNRVDFKKFSAATSKLSAIKDAMTAPTLERHVKMNNNSDPKVDDSAKPTLEIRVELKWRELSNIIEKKSTIIEGNRKQSIIENIWKS